MDHNIPYSLQIPPAFNFRLLWGGGGGRRKLKGQNQLYRGPQIKGAKIKGSENLRQAKGTKVLLKSNTLAEMLLQLQSND